MVAEETEKPAKGDKKEKKGSFWKELPVLVVVALVLALIIKTFVIQAFYIPSESMENTLLTNDRVLVNKLVYHTATSSAATWWCSPASTPGTASSQMEEPSNPVAGVLPLGRHRVRRGARREGLHQAGHRRRRRPRQVLRRQGPHHGQRRADRREELPLSGRRALRQSSSTSRCRRAAVGDGRPPLGLARLPLPHGRPRRRHDPRGPGDRAGLRHRMAVLQGRPRSPSPTRSRSRRSRPLPRLAGPPRWSPGSRGPSRWC